MNISSFLMLVILGVSANAYPHGTGKKDLLAILQLIADTGDEFPGLDYELLKEEEDQITEQQGYPGSELDAIQSELLSRDLLRKGEEQESNTFAESEQGVNVLWAYYGISCANGYINPHVLHRSTDYVKKVCAGKRFCSGLIHTSILTDPYPGCFKDFLAIAQCPDGHIVSNLVRKEAQGSHFFLNCH